MNRDEARNVLAQHLTSWRGRSYDELVASMGRQDVIEARGPSGATYKVEMEALWDNEVGGDVRVFGCIDDRRWRAFLPLTDSFIKAPDGRFVGE